MLEHDGADIALTVLTLVSLVSLVVLINCLGNYYWNPTYWLHFDGFVAVMMGYYRGLLGGRPPDHSLECLQTLLRSPDVPSSVRSRPWRGHCLSYRAFVSQVGSLFDCKHCGCTVGAVSLSTPGNAGCHSEIGGWNCQAIWCFVKKKTKWCV